MVSKIELLCILKDYQANTGVQIADLKKMGKKQMLQFCQNNGITIQGLNVKKNKEKEVKEVEEVDENPDTYDLEKYNQVLQNQVFFLKQENIALLKVIHQHNLYRDYLEYFNKIRNTLVE
jgi:hypothetical protein